jgi:hypothetical protein
MYGFHNGRNVLGLRWPVLLLVLGSLAFGAGCGDFTLFDDGDGGPCQGDPCAGISHAREGSCVVEGTDDFTCTCNTDFEWDDTSNLCLETDPCAGDPCVGIEHAVEGSCVAEGTTDFACDCDTDFNWSDANNTCVSVAQGTCTDLKTCLTACDWDDTACQLVCQAQGSGCDCSSVDPLNPPEDCLPECVPPCLESVQACYECGLACVIDNHCT